MILQQSWHWTNQHKNEAGCKKKLGIMLGMKSAVGAFEVVEHGLDLTDV